MVNCQRSRDWGLLNPKSSSQVSITKNAGPPKAGVSFEADNGSGALV